MRKIIGLFIIFSLVFSVGVFGQEKLNFQDELRTFFGADYENKVSRVGPRDIHKLEYDSKYNGVTAYFDVISTVGSSMAGMTPYDSDFYNNKRVKGSVARLDVRGKYFQNFIVCYDNAFFGEATPGGITTYTPVNPDSNKQVDYPMEDYIRIFEIIDFNRKQVSLVTFEPLDNKSSISLRILSYFEDLYLFPFTMLLQMKDGKSENYSLFYDKKSLSYLLVSRTFILRYKK